MITISKYVLLTGIMFINSYSCLFSQENFWTQTNGPVGGNVTSIAFDGSGKLFCGTQGGTLFYYSGNNQTWKPLFLGATRDNIHSIAFDTNKRIFFSTSKDMFRSSEEGNVWKKINAESDKSEIRTLKVLQNGTLFAGTSSGLFKSLNQGDNWIKVEQLTGPITTLEVYMNNFLVASVGSLAYYSKDRGQNWNQIIFPGNQSGNCLAIGDDQNFFAGTKEGDVFRYEISKNVWLRIARFDYPVVALHVVQGGDVYAGLGGPDFSLEGGGVFMIPTNHEKPKLISSKDSRCMTVMGNKLYVGTSEGVFYSDGEKNSLISFNNGLIAQRVNDIIINKQDQVFVGSYGGVFKSDDNGETWIEKNNGLDEIGILDMAINSQGHLFVGTYASGIFRSTDNGETWQKKNMGIPKMNSNWIMSLAINSKDILFAAVLRGGVYMSTNNGETWGEANNGLESSRYNSLAIDSKDVIYASNDNGNVFRSEDNGNTWIKIEKSDLINEASAEMIVDNEDRLYYGAIDKGLFRYSFGNNNWTELNYGLSNKTIRSLILIDDTLFFAGTSGAKDYNDFSGEDLFGSTDKGESWKLYNTGLNHPRIKALAVNSKGILFAGTWGGGVYRSISSVINK